MLRPVVSAMLTLALFLVLSACSGGSEHTLPDLDGDLADNDSAESEVADGNAEEEADTDGEVSEPASSAVPLFNGFSAAAGSMASRSYQLTFSFAPAALATPTVSNNGSVRLLSTISPLTK